MGCDLNQYFKEPIDTDGLTAHHNQVQERLVRIFASHQAEVQALRRDLQCTRVALFKHKSLLSSSRGCNGSVNAALACNSDNEILQGDIEMGKEAKAATMEPPMGPPIIRGHLQRVHVPMPAQRGRLLMKKKQIQHFGFLTMLWLPV